MYTIPDGILAKILSRFGLARRLREPLYVGQHLITSNNADFGKRAYEAMPLELADIPWIYRVSQWAAAHANKLEGIFVECGVYRGATALSVLRYTKTKKPFYLLDTFSGMPEKYASTKEFKKYGSLYSDTYGEVRERFALYPNVHLVRGIVPDTLPAVEGPVAFLHIDLNAAAPEAAALRYFWPRMSRGGVIVFDDYAQPGIHTNQKAALDEVAAELDFEILALPTGQGLAIKI